MNKYYSDSSKINLKILRKPTRSMKIIDVDSGDITDCKSGGGGMEFSVDSKNGFSTGSTKVSKFIKKIKSFAAPVPASIIVDPNEYYEKQTKNLKEADKQNKKSIRSGLWGTVAGGVSGLTSAALQFASGNPLGAIISGASTLFNAKSSLNSSKQSRAMTKKQLEDQKLQVKQQANNLYQQAAPGMARARTYSFSMSNGVKTEVDRSYLNSPDMIRLISLMNKLKGTSDAHGRSRIVYEMFTIANKITDFYVVRFVEMIIRESEHGNIDDCIKQLMTSDLMTRFKTSSDIIESKGASDIKPWKTSSGDVVSINSRR